MATATSWNSDRHPSAGTAKLAPAASVVIARVPRNSPTATPYQRGTLAAPVQSLARIAPPLVTATLALTDKGYTATVAVKSPGTRQPRRRRAPQDARQEILDAAR